MTPHQLPEAIARTPWEDLLPAHRLEDGSVPSGAPTCLEVLDLAAGHHVAVVADLAGNTYPVPLIDTARGVRRARAGDGTGEALLRTLRAGDQRIGGFELTSWHHESCSGERAITVDQTNESVVIGDAAVLKWTFQLAESPTPGMLTALNRQGFTGMPRAWGLLQWHPPHDAPAVLVASIVSFIPGAVDGWTWALDDLHADVVLQPGHRLADSASAVGDLVAGLHTALSHNSSIATSTDSSEWAEQAAADLDLALNVTSGPAHALLQQHEPAIRSLFGTVADRDGTFLGGVHGDLHVGQVLCCDDGLSARYVVTDFDGNPVIPAAERRRPQPAALDVASLTQSLVHVGIVLGHREPTASPAEVQAVVTGAVASFNAAYAKGLARHDRSALFDPALVHPFRVRQVCREFTYAATHLARWSYVPEAAMPALMSPGVPS